ncbi:MAG: hypothetical protein UH625_01440 [Muribaculaceae bacterium]|nr:hypothetical protein [Muribaculaceae bacterium]
MSDVDEYRSKIAIFVMNLKINKTYETVGSTIGREITEYQGDKIAAHESIHMGERMELTYLH